MSCIRVGRHQRARPARVGRATRLLALAALALAALAPAVAADASAAGPSWRSLSAAQQAALAPLKDDWAGIDAARKQKWLEVAARIPSMPADERARVQERMEQWSQLSPAERGQARLQFQQARQINTQDRAAAWDAYRALPAEQRRALAKSARTIPRAPSAAASARQARGVDAPPKADGPPKVAQPGTARAIAPTLVQVGPGATTKLISQTRAAPPQDQPRKRQPTVPADRVDRKTLLPRSDLTPAGPAAAASPTAALTLAATPAATPAASAAAAPAASAAATSAATRAAAPAPNPAPTPAASGQAPVVPVRAAAAASTVTVGAASDPAR